MPEPLTFMMGKHPAALPGDLRYCRNHMWCRPDAEGVCRFGFTAYALRLMQDVYFLEWSVDLGAPISARGPIGYIETSKAQSELYAPVAGTISSFNAVPLRDPSAINVDGYGDGWLFETVGGSDGTMGVAQYCDFLTDAWLTAQRLIKGQLNATDD